ncbi:MAG: metalloregulator ArsR/SmtB family transcription factor [Hyphomicrobiaceae bacterium]
MSFSARSKHLTIPLALSKLAFMNIQELTVRSEEASQLLSMLANPHRLRILCELHKGERSVSSLEQAIGISQSALSQHLAKLRAAGLVATRREAQSIYYSVADERAAKLLPVLYEIFCVPSVKSRRKK